MLRTTRQISSTEYNRLKRQNGHYRKLLKEVLRDIDTLDDSAQKVTCGNLPHNIGAMRGALQSWHHILVKELGIKE